MALKRKRSLDSPDDFLSSTSSTSSLSPTSSRASLSPSSRPLSPFASWGLRKPSSTALNSRTRKRLRDNRPDEAIIHEATLAKLFSAQRHNPRAEPRPTRAPEHFLPAPPTMSTAAAVSAPQKSSLHAFWRLPGRPATPPLFPSQQTGGAAGGAREQLCCGDCDAPLGAEAGDEMDVDVEVGGMRGVGARGCWGCGRTVCDFCAVVREERWCLGCAAMR